MTTLTSCTSEESALDLIRTSWTWIKGEEINQAKIVEIDPNQVILEYKGEKITLTVIEEEELQ